MRLITQYMIQCLTRVYIDDGQALKPRTKALLQSSGRAVIIASHFTGAQCDPLARQLEFGTSLQECPCTLVVWVSWC